MMSVGSKMRLANLLCFGLLAGPCLAGNIEGKVTVEGIKSAASIVVYIDGVADGNLTPPSEHVAVHQQKMTFIPHVLAVQQGTTVDFYNDDPVSHGVSWPSVAGNKKLAHHLGIWGQGGMKPFTFNDLGVVPLLCYLHPEMSGYIVVVPTPYFAITQNDGSFVIQNVPPGNHVLKFWSEDGEPVSQQIQVADTSETINVTVHRAHTRGGDR